MQQALLLRFESQEWQVVEWVKACLPDDPDVAEIFGQQRVNCAALLKLTYERLVAKPYEIPGGPASNLADLIAGVSPSEVQAGRRDGRLRREFTYLFVDLLIFFSFSHVRGIAAPDSGEDCQGLCTGFG